MNWTAFQIDAHTKVNLYLRVLRRREDGYHELDTVFQELAWGDRLEFRPADQFGFRSTGLSFDDGGDNICLRAYRSFCEAYGSVIPVEIILQKEVPPGSGLGGGSADAAAVLKGLNRVAQDKLSNDSMLELAVRIGADVPFFLKGKLQRGLGVGEKLTPLDASFDGYFLLVIPPIHVSTKQAFKAMKIELTAQGVPVTFGRLVDKANMVRFFENDFESVVFHIHPEIGVIKQELLKAGAYFASLSGSGSTVYGIFDKLETAVDAQARLINRYHTQITTPQN